MSIAPGSPDVGPTEAAPAPVAPAASRAGARSHSVHQVSFVAYPKIMFTWPLILAGFLFWFMAPPSAGHSNWLETMGWLYLTVMLLVVLTLGVDVGRNQAIFWGVVIFALWMLNLWMTDAKSIPLFGTILGWFGALDVQYNRSMGLATSFILLVPFLVMIAWSHLNDRWRITHNEFEHYSFGRMDDSLGRGAKTIRSEFPDVFELLLGAAGTLIVYNASGTQELRRIPHVLFLPLVRKKLAQILEFTAVTGAATEEDEEQ